MGRLVTQNRQFERMKDRYEFHRGFANVVVKQYTHLQDQEFADKVFSYVAKNRMMNGLFNRLYYTLIREKEIKPLEEMPEDYKNELLDTAKELLPEDETEWQLEYCKSMASFLWLLNN